jgi:hypothetical protein
MTNPGAYAVEVWFAEGGLAGKGQLDNPIGGWHSFDFHQGQGGFTPSIPDGMFKVRLVNLSSGTREAHGGSLTMVHKHIWEEFYRSILIWVRDLISRR